MQVIISESNNVIHNMALEEFLLKFENGDPFLYLWINDKAVIIGRNQNPYAECDVEYADANAIEIVRRLSGGGAVYHDLGNINYTVFFDVKRHYKEIVNKYLLDVLKKCNIYAQVNGRNDIEAEGRKLSGTAYHIGETRAFHHGCLLIDTDIDTMNRVLRPNNSKLKSKGIVSVKSRVTNMKCLNPNIQIKDVMHAFIECASTLLEDIEEERLVVKCVNPEEILEEPFLKLVEKYRSKEWNYRRIDAEYFWQRDFSWGNCAVLMTTDYNTVKQMIFYSDAMESNLFEQISNWMNGTRFDKVELKRKFEAMTKLYIDNQEEQKIICDISEMVDSELKL